MVSWQVCSCYRAERVKSRDEGGSECWPVTFHFCHITFFSYEKKSCKGRGLVNKDSLELCNLR